MPSLRDLLTIDMIGLRKAALCDFRMLVGMLKGPEDLDASSLSIRALISFDVQELSVIEYLFGSPR